MSTDEAQAPSDSVGDLFGWVGLLVCLHVWTSVHVLLAFGPAGGVFYFATGPIAAFVLTLAALPFLEFALAIGLTSSISAALLWRATRKRLATHPYSRLFLVAAGLTWLPVLSGQVIGAVSMRAAIVRLEPECHRTTAFIASLREWPGGSRHAFDHGWAIRGGKRYHWSYRAMDFVPDARPWGHGVRCD